MKKNYSLLDVVCFHAFLRLPYWFTDWKPAMRFLLPRVGRYAYDESHVPKNWGTPVMRSQYHVDGRRVFRIPHDFREFAQSPWTDTPEKAWKNYEEVVAADRNWKVAQGNDAGRP